MATKKAKNVEQTWNEIRGTMRIFGNTFPGKKGKPDRVLWSVSVGSKSKDGEYFNAYIPIRFAGKSEEPASDGLHTIEIEKAFFGCNHFMDKQKIEHYDIELVVLENEVID